MYVVVQIKQNAKAVVQGGSQAVMQVPQDVQEAVLQLNLHLEPMHPGATDATLSRYYYIEVPDAATADTVVERLRNSPSVEAAYLKPPEGPP